MPTAATGKSTVAKVYDMPLVLRLRIGSSFVSDKWKSTFRLTGASREGKITIEKNSATQIKITDESGKKSETLALSSKVEENTFLEVVFARLGIATSSKLSLTVEDQRNGKDPKYDLFEKTEYKEVNTVPCGRFEPDSDAAENLWTIDKVVTDAKKISEDKWCGIISDQKGISANKTNSPVVVYLSSQGYKVRVIGKVCTRLAGIPVKGVQVKLSKHDRHQVSGDTGEVCFDGRIYGRTLSIGADYKNKEKKLKLENVEINIEDLDLTKYEAALGTDPGKGTFYLEENATINVTNRIKKIQDVQDIAAETEEAKDVTGHSVKLKGTVKNAPKLTKYKFEYGETVVYEKETEATTNKDVLEATLSDLNPGTTYHFRLVALLPVSDSPTPVPISQSEDKSFTTDAISVRTKSAVVRSSKQVDLFGEVNANEAVEGFFEIEGPDFGSGYKTSQQTITIIDKSLALSLKRDGDRDFEKGKYSVTAKAKVGSKIYDGGSVDFIIGKPTLEVKPPENMTETQATLVGVVTTNGISLQSVCFKVKAGKKIEQVSPANGLDLKQTEPLTVKGTFKGTKGGNYDYWMEVNDSGSDRDKKPYKSEEKKFKLEQTSSPITTGTKSIFQATEIPDLKDIDFADSYDPKNTGDHFDLKKNGDTYEFIVPIKVATFSLDVPYRNQRTMSSKLVTSRAYEPDEAVVELPITGDVLCGPTSVLMLLKFWGESNTDQDVIKEILEDCYEQWHSDKGFEGRSIQKVFIGKEAGLTQEVLESHVDDKGNVYWRDTVEKKLKTKKFKWLVWEKLDPVCHADKSVWTNNYLPDLSKQVFDPDSVQTENVIFQSIDLNEWFISRIVDVSPDNKLSMKSADPLLDPRLISDDSWNSVPDDWRLRGTGGRSYFTFPDYHIKFLKVKKGFKERAEQIWKVKDIEIGRTEKIKLGRPFVTGTEGHYIVCTGCVVLSDNKTVNWRIYHDPFGNFAGPMSNYFTNIEKEYEKEKGRSSYYYDYSCRNKTSGANEGEGMHVYYGKSTQSRHRKFFLKDYFMTINPSPGESSVKIIHGDF